MMHKFVPNNEKTRAISKLWSLKMSGSMDKHISEFLDLINLAEDTDQESYNYFFNSLHGKYKKEFISEYSSTEFPSMQEVFKFARKLDFSDEFDADRAPSKGSSQKFDKSISGQVTPGGNSSVGKFQRSTNAKDPSSVSWGPAGKGETHCTALLPEARYNILVHM